MGKDNIRKLGILAIVFTFLVPMVGFILGIIVIGKTNRMRELGELDGENGQARTLGIVAVVICSVSLFLFIVLVGFLIWLMISLANALPSGF